MSSFSRLIPTSTVIVAALRARNRGTSLKGGHLRGNSQYRPIATFEKSEQTRKTRRFGVGDSPFIRRFPLSSPLSSFRRFRCRFGRNGKSKKPRCVNPTSRIETSSKKERKNSPLSSKVIHFGLTFPPSQTERDLLSRDSQATCTARRKPLPRL